MHEKFQNHLKALCPDWQGARFMVAFSGGLDSTALLHLTALILPSNRLSAAHLNHQLRGEDAVRDQEFAHKTADLLSVKFIFESRDVNALARMRHKGIEEAARRARYDFLDKVSLEWQADYVLTAHQADDQAETMIMNFIKGSGAGGLAGIHERRPLKRLKPAELSPELKQVELIRPLLPFTRSDLKVWLIKNNLPWVEDLSNQDNQYLRNSLRNDILPNLKKINPRLISAMQRTSSIFRQEENFWKIHLAGLWLKLVTEKAKNCYVIDRSGLDNLTLAEKRRLIYEILNKIWITRPIAGEPLSFASIKTVIDLLNTKQHKGLDIPGGLRVTVSSKVIELSLASRFV